MAAFSDSGISCKQGLANRVMQRQGAVLKQSVQLYY